MEGARVNALHKTADPAVPAAVPAVRDVPLYWLGLENAKPQKRSYDEYE